MATLSDLIQRIRVVVVDADKLKGQVKDIGDSFEQLGSRMRRVGRTMSLAITTPIVAGFAGAIKAATDFESAMADVRKVVDFPTPEAFTKLGEDLRDLSLRVPVAAEGLADIAAAAGAAGIAAQDLTKFTELVAQISVAFELTADETGTALAKIQTALGLTIDEVSLLSDQMNVLANGMASSEAEILTVVNRTAALGEMAGVAYKDIAALGSAMVSMGTDSQRASTAVRNILLTFQAGEAATDTQAAAWEKLGYTSVEMAERIQNEGLGVVVEVFEKIRSMAPEVRASILDQLFDKRVVDAAGPLINNLDVLRQAIGLVADDATVAGSALREYETRANTAANKFKLFQNTLNELAITIGAELLPVVLQITEYVQEWVQTASNAEKILVKWGVAIAAVAAAFGPLIYVVGSMLTVTGKLINGISGLVGGLQKLRNWYKLTAAAGLLAFGPASAIIVGLGLVAAAIYYLSTKQSEAEIATQEHETAIKQLREALEQVKNGLPTEEIKHLAQAHFEAAQAAYEDAKAHLAFLEAARRGERGPGAVAQATDRALAAASESLLEAERRFQAVRHEIDEISVAASRTASSIATTIPPALDAVGNSANVVGENTIRMVRGGVESFEQLGGVAQETKRVYDELGNVIGGVEPQILRVKDGVVQATADVKQAGEATGQATETVSSKIIQLGETSSTAISAIADSTEQIKASIGAIPALIEGIPEAIQAIPAQIADIAPQIESALSPVFNIFKQLETSAFNTAGGIANAFRDGADAIHLAFLSAIDRIHSQFVSMAAGVRALIDRLRSQLQALQAAIQSAKAAAAGSAAGGLARARGGMVWGAGTATSDSIPARLSRGEYVLRAAAVAKYGTRLLDLLNAMKLPRDFFKGFDVGGFVDSIAPRMPRYAAGGFVQAQQQFGGNNMTPLNLTIFGETFEGLLAPEHTASQLVRYSVGKQNVSTGSKPWWYR